MSSFASSRICKALSILFPPGGGGLLFSGGGGGLLFSGGGGGLLFSGGGGGLFGSDGSLIGVSSEIGSTVAWFSVFSELEHAEVIKIK